MTAQIPDTLVVDGRPNAVVGVDGEELFHPGMIGVPFPHWTSSANWRGYICTYVIRDRILMLRDLLIGLDSPPDPVAGVAPQMVRYHAWMYRHVHTGIDFTGRLLAGDDVMRPVLRAGYPAAWQFRHVWELEFRHGELSWQADRSTELAEVRRRFVTDEGRFTPAFRETFQPKELSYDFAWPGHPARRGG